MWFHKKLQALFKNGHTLSILLYAYKLVLRHHFRVKIFLNFLRR